LRSYAHFLYSLRSKRLLATMRISLRVSLVSLTSGTNLYRRSVLFEMNDLSRKDVSSSSSGVIPKSSSPILHYTNLTIWSSDGADDR
jgi:hypothetical protein